MWGGGGDGGVRWRCEMGGERGGGGGEQEFLAPVSLTAASATISIFLGTV